MEERGRSPEGSPAAQAALDVAGRSICIGLFLVAGTWFAVLIPGSGLAAGVQAITVCVLGAAGMWRAHGSTSEAASLGGWLIPPLVVASLAVLQTLHAEVNWWPVIDTAALGAVMVAGTMQPLVRSATAAVLSVSAAMMPAVAGVPNTVSSGSPQGYRLAQLLISYAIPLFGSVLLRRTERRAAARVESDDEMLMRIGGRSREVAQASVQRVLHDTVLNTLEAVANGVPDERWGQLRRRCRADLADVGRIADILPAREISDLVDEVQYRGVSLETDVEWLADPPPLVREAVLAATAEAIRNAAKHSRANVVHLRARMAADSAFVEVADAGTGFVPTASARLGLRASIVGSMQAVGGHASVESVPGEGTRVALGWDGARARVAAMLAGMRRRLLLVFTAGTVLSLLSFVLSSFVDSGRSSLTLRLGIIVIASAVLGLLVRPALRTGVRRPEFAGALLGLASVTLLIPLTDPLCVSPQSAYPFDLRAVLIVVFALTVVNRWDFAVSLTVLLLSSAVGNVLWIGLGSACGWNYVMGGGVATAIAIGGFLFARTMDEQERTWASAAVGHENELLAQSQRAARAKEVTRWSSLEVAQAIGVLRDIVDGEPDSPRLRRRAREVAQQVRQWLLLRGTVGPVPEVITDSLTRWPHAPVIRVDGDPRSVDDAGISAQNAAQRLHDWLPRVPGATVAITVSRTGSTASVLARSDRPGACDDPDAWSDEDGWWLHLTWSPDPAHVPQQ